MGSHFNNWMQFWLATFGSVVILLSPSLPALAETKLLNINLSTAENQSFADLIQQAELIATESLDRELNRLPTVTQIEIIVTGKRNGQEVPLLSTKVSRQDWQAHPSIQLWTNYLTKTGILLGFDSPSKLKNNLSNPVLGFSSNRHNLESDPGFRDD